MGLISRATKDLEPGDIVFDQMSGARLGQVLDTEPSATGLWTYVSFDRSGLYKQGCFGVLVGFNVIPWRQP